jgi:hypothetical protein
LRLFLSLRVVWPLRMFPAGMALLLLLTDIALLTLLTRMRFCSRATFMPPRVPVAG